MPRTEVFTACHHLYCMRAALTVQLIISYQNMMGLDDNKELAQKAWNYMNDSLRTSVFMQYSPEAIACSCLHLGCLTLGRYAAETVGLRLCVPPCHCDPSGAISGDIGRWSKRGR